MTGDKKCAVCNIVGVLVVLGALNWGLVGFFQKDLVASLLGEMTGAARVVYGFIGVAGILKLLSMAKCCPCQKGACTPKPNA